MSERPAGGARGLDTFVYLARHGQTAYNLEGRFQGQQAIPLGSIQRDGRASGERRFSYADMGAGSVQVEFGRIPDAELDDLSDPELDDVVSDNDTDLGAGGDGH